MKTSEVNRLLALVTLGLVATGFSTAQDGPKAASTIPYQSAASSGITKPLTVSGKVSNNGHSLLTDLDTEWTVSNPEVLKGREGRLVMVKCRVDAERNQIHVLSVMGAQPEIGYSSRLGDSAFRR